MAITFPTIRQLTSSSFPFSQDVPLGKLHYRALEKDETIALRKAYGNFDKIVAKISVKNIDELNW